MMIVQGEYVKDFSILLHLSNGDTKLVDFLPHFQAHVRGENLKYFSPDRFKKFIIKNGNIYWGKNEDVIFPIETLYQQTNSTKEKVLYII